MKKYAVFMLTMCFVIFICTTAVGAENLDAVSYVETLCSGDAKGLTESYPHTEELLDALKQSGGLEGLQTALKSFGELQKASEPIISEIMGYTSYSVPCTFELQKLNLVLNVDGEGRIAGIVTALYMEETVSDEDILSKVDGITEIDLNIPVDGKEGWELPGTLTLPEGEGSFPVVILVHGSGPNDRDETVGSNKPFRDIAYGLAQEGIAVYRYDKRTYVYGQEMASDTALTLAEETILDAVKAVEIMKEQAQINPEQIYLAGHSLGGQALPAIHSALENNADAAGYIFLAAPARKLTELMREQYDFLYSLTPVLDEAQEKQKTAVYEELDKLENLDNLKNEDAVLGAFGTYWKYLENYDQVAEAVNILQPCLVLQGEEDYQVTMEDFAIWQETYGEKDNWEFQSYAGLTHLFMTGEKENASADYQKEQSVDTQVIRDMATFIKEH